jgi:hypothetical protein
VADRIDDDGLRLQAHHAAWTTLRSTGGLIDALRHIELGRALYDPERHRFTASSTAAMIPVSAPI